MKTALIALVAVVIGIFAIHSVEAQSLRVLPPSQGGTGISSTTGIGVVGDCLVVAATSPFTYDLTTCGGGGGASDGLFSFIVGTNVITTDAATSTGTTSLQSSTFTASSTSATSTFPWADITTRLKMASDFFTDLTGYGLTASGTTLALDGTIFKTADFDAGTEIAIDYTNGQKATSLIPGFLTSADWTIFQNKISSTSIDTEAEWETFQSGTDYVTVTSNDISSANLATILSDETGTAGSAVFSGSPTFTGSTTFSGDVQIGGTAGQNQLKVAASTVHGASNSVGGMVNLTNLTTNTGPALVVYGNAASSVGNLTNFRCDNTGMTHDCVKIDNDGAGDGLAIAGTAASSNALSLSNTGLDHTLNVAYTGTTAQKGAMNLTSTNMDGSVFQVAGNSKGLGVGKITHNATGSLSSSILSLDASTANYIGQGIFLDSSGGGWTGSKILNLRVNGVELITASTSGFFGLASTSPAARLGVNGNAYIAGDIYATGTATTTGLHSTVICLTGDTCRTTWPTGGGSGGNSKWATSSVDTRAIHTSSADAVGIGTTSPKWGLQVASTTPYVGITDSDAPINSRNWIMSAVNGQFRIGTTSDANLEATSTALTITTGSGLLVGTTSSAATGLAVSGTGRWFGLTAPGATANSLCIDANTEEVYENAASSCLVSSRRFKHDIGELDAGGLDLLRQFKPSVFTYNTTNQHRWGFIAEDMAALSPTLAEYDGDVPQSLDIPAILAVTVKAVQELDARKAVQDKWQWFVIGILALVVLRQQWQIKKLS